MPFSTITFEKSRHVAGIRLDRPEMGNAINQQMLQEITQVCEEMGGDDDVRVVVITGAGDGAFCKGSELAGSCGVAAAIDRLEQPVIAAINGDALGAGLEMALSCDIRLAAVGARFGLPQVAEALIPMDGGTQRLPRIVGRGKALEMILTADAISAEEALEMGLVNRLVAPEALATEAQALAKSLAAKAPVALRYAKEAVGKGLDLSLDQGLRLEADLYFLLHTTADRTEGIKAFLEKRTPEFGGR